MTAAVNGHADDPSPTVLLKLLNVPKRGAITIRFLGELMATMTHWVPGKPDGHTEVCLNEDCPATMHKIKAVWKGYAPAEVWREIEKDWYPGVIEITEALGQQLAARTLTGELWTLQRCKGEFKHPEVVGTFLQFDRPAPIDARTWVETVCFRLYRTREIRWGAQDPLPTRVRIETRKASPPPNLPASTPEKSESQKPPSKSFRQMRQEAGLPS